ncbi:MAG: DUF192 domain-containing protein [Granulosicoccus sp.]
MKNNAIDKDLLRTRRVGVQEHAANDQPVCTRNTDSVKRRRLNNWSSLSTLKPVARSAVRPEKSPRSGGRLICTISRAGTPLLSSYLANTGLSRLRGLFAFPPLMATDALVLHPCSAVHTFGFRQTVDVAFINKYGVILRCIAMKPYTMSLCWGAHSVVEMADGTVERLHLELGQKLDIHLTEGCDE